MEVKKFIAENLSQTQKIARDLAVQLSQWTKTDLKQEAVVVALTGDLGSGKTSFVQGFAKALGIKGKITSPTFVIQKNYKLKTKNYKLLVHIDAYRLDDPQELIDLGWVEIVGDSGNIIIVEWAGKIKKILPKKHIKINFTHTKDDKRKITLNF